MSSLRAKFERKTRAQTPAEFLAAQKLLAEKEAAEILLARKKAATFNMALRQMELAKHADVSNKTTAQKAEREQLRAQARRVSTVLRKLDETPTRPAEDVVQRRATTMMMADMASELEREMRQEEERAKQEEREAQKRTQDAERDRAEAIEAARRATEAAELARLAREEADRVQRGEAEERERREREAAEREAEAEVARQKNAELAAQLEAEEKDRQVLTSYLRENYPEKLADVEPLLKQFKGNLDVLFDELARGQKFRESVDKGRGGRAGRASDADSLIVDGGAAAAVAAAKPASTETAKTTGGKKFLDEGVDCREVITRFYQVFAASKLSDIDDILKHFDNREADLFRTLEVKYDVTFSTDGKCNPNDGDKVGGAPFMEGIDGLVQAPPSSKFAVDVQQFTLKEKLAKQGQSSDKIAAVLSSGSAMM